MKKLVIAGNGGFSREVEWLVNRINKVSPTWEFLGFIDNLSKEGKVVGDDDFVTHYKEELYVALGIGNSKVREKIYKKYRKNPKIQFANLIDPSVMCSDRILLGGGNIVCAGTILTVDITIGNCNIINLACTIGHDVVLGDFVTVNPGVNISGNTSIGSGCNIGTGTKIIQGLRIGKNTVVGAGAVVTKELPDDSTAVGIPAKVIKIKEDRVLE
ncbi:MAG: acetyltransferase [Lachnospiraceae bacterium]|nr:acetyltransferase [Lachnospiraceae bacterium]